MSFQNGRSNGNLKTPEATKSNKSHTGRMFRHKSNSIFCPANIMAMQVNYQAISTKMFSVRLHNYQIYTSGTSFYHLHQVESHFMFLMVLFHVHQISKLDLRTCLLLLEKTFFKGNGGQRPANYIMIIKVVNIKG